MFTVQPIITMKTSIFLSIFFSAALAAWGQPSEGCRGDSLYQLMDFWVGEWDVYDRQDSLLGYNSVIKMLDECAILENWEGREGGQGKSLFYVDNSSGNWKQVWVTANAPTPGGQKEKELIYARTDSLLIFQGTYRIDQASVLDRTLLRKVSDGEVNQTIQLSRDGGQSWQTTFVGIYRRPE